MGDFFWDKGGLNRPKWWRIVEPFDFVFFLGVVGWFRIEGPHFCEKKQKCVF